MNSTYTETAKPQDNAFGPIRTEEVSKPWTSLCSPLPPDGRHRLFAMTLLAVVANQR